MAVFPLLALPPEERRAIGGCDSTGLVPPESWARFPVLGLRSRRLTEPPRPASVGVLEISLTLPTDLRALASWARFPVFGVMVTAADKAAATFVAQGDEPLRPPAAGASPFRGGFAGSTAKRLPPQKELSAVRLTEDRLFCWGVHCCSGRIYLPRIRCRGWSPPLFCGRRQGVAAKPPQVSVSPLSRRRR